MSTDTTPASPAFDPYDTRPNWVQRHREPVIAVVVFVLTAVLTVASFPPYEVPECAYAALVPGLLWAYRAPALRLYAASLLGAQVVAWTVILGWLHNVTWVGLFLLGPFVGLWVGVWFLLAWWVMPRMAGRPHFTRLLAMVGLAGAWVLLEWTRTWFLTGFPWLPLAASQWQRATILQIAAYTGAYGISFVLVAMNIGFAAYAHRLFFEGASGFAKRSQEFFLALFLLLVCLSIHFQEAFNRPRFVTPLGRVGFVQPYIPQDVKWDPGRRDAILRVLEQTTLAVAGSRPDLILWPEAVTPLSVLNDESLQAFVQSISRRANAPLLLGSIAATNFGTPEEKWVNGAFVVRPSSGLAPERYEKRHLVPFGEYVPLRPLLGWLRKFVPIGEDFTPGEGATPLVVPINGDAINVGPLICYEDVYPQLARRSVQEGAAVLAVLTNNGWFGEGAAAYQHAAHSVLRAVETRRPLLRCGNGGWSGWIDEFGGIRANLTNSEDSIYFRGGATVNITRDARWVGRESFYVMHGDWFVAASALMLVLGVGILKIAGAPMPRMYRIDRPVP